MSHIERQQWRERIARALAELKKEDARSSLGHSAAGAKETARDRRVPDDEE